MIVAYGWTDGTQSMNHSSDLDNRARVCLNCGRIHEDRHDKMVIYVDSADLKLRRRIVFIGDSSHVLLVESQIICACYYLAFARHSIMAHPSTACLMGSRDNCCLPAREIKRLNFYRIGAYFGCVRWLIRAHCQGFTNSHRQSSSNHF